MLNTYSDNHPWLYRNLGLTIKPNKCTVFVASQEGLRSVVITCGGLRKLIRPTRAGVENVGPASRAATMIYGNAIGDAEFARNDGDWRMAA